MNHEWQAATAATTETQFRAWASKISEAFDAIGMVQVAANAVASDWDAIISGYSTAANTEHAWEVWAFPPSATQTAAPVFVRVGYGIGASTTRPRVSVQLAGTSGSGGVLTGFGGTVVAPSSTGVSTSATLRNNFAASDGHGFVLVLAYDSTDPNERTLIVVDRHRNGNGQPLTSGLSWWWMNGNPNAVITARHYDLVTDVSEASTNFVTVTQGGIVESVPKLSGDAQAQLFPWWAVMRNGIGVSKMVCAYPSTDIAPFVDREVEWLPSTGSVASRTIRGLGSAFSSSNIDANGSTGLTAAMWWSDP